ncbi:hypothetical protein JYT91_01035 [archaeon AH-315-M20]|nr:hypothetical protein [archaeon AH-315-M20]
MSNCPYCGKEIAIDERYCWHCEQDLEDKESYKNKPTKPLKEKIKDFFRKFR